MYARDVLYSLIGGSPHTYIVATKAKAGPPGQLEQHG